ncbi:MAG: hypothetical protein HWN68_01485 [Desulfobacterales bacterium]|nr:hypothetical protein [Desulfobacterales bacterium]
MTGRRHVPNEPKSWTILLVGEVGKIVSFHLSKPSVVALTAGVTAVLAFVVFSLVSYYVMRAENMALKNNLGTLEANLAAANKAKEVAIVRLMVLEDRKNPGKKKPRSASGRKPPEQTSQPARSHASTGRDTKDDLSSGVKWGADASPVQPTGAAEDERPASMEKILIQSPRIQLDAENNSVKFQFGLKNADLQGNRIKGYTFMVLKPEEGSTYRVRISPWSPMEDGKPVVFKRGQYFSILRFKFVKGNFPDISTIERFKTAVIYIYSETGSLLVERAFEVEEILRS